MSHRVHGRRGRTRSGRLERLDAYLLAAEERILLRRDGPWARAVVVDLGLGDRPDTTAELQEALGDVRVVGVDHDPQRVEVARRLAPHLDLRVGGFDLPLSAGEPARLVRVLNVLREYRPEDVAPAHRALGAALLPGGLLVEGSSDAEGSVVVATLVRRTEAGLEREGLLMSTDFARGFAPRLFRDWLPRDLRRRHPDSPLARMLARWTDAFDAVRAEGIRTPPEAFLASARRVAELDDRWAADGHVVWRPTRGCSWADPEPPVVTRG